MRGSYEWHHAAPVNDGDFFYTGPTPDGTNIVAVVQVFTNPETQRKEACLFIPPNWRGNKEQKAMIHHGKIEQWTGEWAGPEYGLCCVANN